MTKKPFKLSYSSFARYEECPQRYLYSKGWKGFDLGAGDGNPKPITEKRTEVDAFLGTVIQNVMELFYNDELWRKKNLKLLLEKETRNSFKKSQQRFYIEWDKVEKDQLEQDCIDAVLNAIVTIKKNKLLGSYAKSEVALELKEENFHIHGIVDFIIDTKEHGLIILDGKNSKRKGKYTSVDQLYWYALILQNTVNRPPDKLSFLYWRFPYKEGGEDTGVSWIPFSMEEMKALKERARNVYASIMATQFQATPSVKACFFCPYKKDCDAFLEFLKSQEDENESKGFQELGFN